jgi:hypothetical protein
MSLFRGLLAALFPTTQLCIANATLFAHVLLTTRLGVFRFLVSFLFFRCVLVSLLVVNFGRRCAFSCRLLFRTATCNGEFSVGGRCVTGVIFVSGTGHFSGGVRALERRLSGSFGRTSRGILKGKQILTFNLYF